MSKYTLTTAPSPDGQVAVIIALGEPADWVVHDDKSWKAPIAAEVVMPVQSFVDWMTKQTEYMRETYHGTEHYPI